jgi:hypothetical protein
MTTMDNAISLLRQVKDHWDEFGPEHGFDETMEGVRRFLTGHDKAKPGPSDLDLAGMITRIGKGKYLGYEIPPEIVDAAEALLATQGRAAT